MQQTELQLTENDEMEAWQDGKNTVKACLLNTRQVTRATHHIYAYPEIKEYAFSNGRALKKIFIVDTNA